MTRARATQRAAKRRSTGFTLVELMAVVIIVAILAAVGVYSVRKYMLSARTSEAVEMIGAIKAAEEAYKAETFSYKDVSGNNNLDDYSSFWPQTTTPPVRKKFPWGTGTAGFRELGVGATGPVLYTYGCAAGPGSSAPAAPGITIGNYPSAAPGAPWYLIKAVGDLDGDGTVGTWVGINITPEIFHDKQEE